MKNLCVIILHYFSPESTAACVDSLIGQALDTLYLVDNSANKEQAALLETLANKVRQQADFSVVVLISAENLGFGRGINSAIKKDYLDLGGHKLYLLLNNDTVVPANTLQILLDEKQCRPNVALLSPAIQWAGKDVGYHYYNALLGHVSEAPLKFSKPYVSGCCLLVDAELIDQNQQLFDQSFFMYGEDVHLNWRAKKSGKEIYCTDKVSIYHEGSGSSSHGNIFYEYHVARGHVLLGLKSQESILLRIAFILGRVFYLLFRAVVRSLRFSSLVPLKAYVMAWFPLHVRVKK